MLRYLVNKFWDEDVWLPPNTTWDDLAPGPDKTVVYNDHRHLLYPLPLALVLIVLRHILEKYWFAPFGKSLGIKNTRPKKAPSNPKLEAAYQTSPKIKHKQICALAKQLDMSERQVERWWRLRRSQDKPSTLVKFCENAWRCTFYLYNFSFGMFILWDKIWLWEIDHCYIGYPHQQLDMSERVERWWRLRRSQDKPSTLVKFCENAWRCTFYLYNFSFGMFILWDKIWLWEIDHCYIGYPHQQLDMSERVERWWRLRRSQDKPSTLVKFCENAWRCTFYLYNFSFGMFILWDKIWLWEIDHCYIGYPHQGLTTDVWWYYMISSAFYWSLTLSQFWDVRRKDFWQMFVHHIATIALLSFSWVCNLHRIGTLVLLSHDCADIFLEAAKATKYAGFQRFCDCVFAVFTVLWIVTRLGVYPFYIIWSTLIRAPMLLPMFPAYYIFNSLLCLLLALHMVWTWLILQVAYKTIKAGQMEGDIRSSSSDISDSSHYSNHSTPNRVNNKKDT